MTSSHDSPNPENRLPNPEKHKKLGQLRRTYSLKKSYEPNAVGKSPQSESQLSPPLPPEEKTVKKPGLLSRKIQEKHQRKHQQKHPAKSESKISTASIKTDWRRKGITKEKNPKEKKKKGSLLAKLPAFWQSIKKFYMVLGVTLFLCAATTVIIAFSKPWFMSWLKQERPSITLPGIDNLRKMPREDRMRLRDTAIQLAPFEARKVISDPLPFADGRPAELKQFRLYPSGENVRVVGVLRLYELPDERRFLRLSDFEITAGYDLRVLLSVARKPKNKQDLETQGYVDLAPLKGENGPQNYLLPQTFRLDDFGAFVIYDKLFEIIYVTAPL